MIAVCAQRRRRRRIRVAQMQQQIAFVRAEFGRGVDGERRKGRAVVRAVRRAIGAPDEQHVLNVL